MYGTSYLPRPTAHTASYFTVFHWNIPYAPSKTKLLCLNQIPSAKLSYYRFQQSYFHEVPKELHVLVLYIYIYFVIKRSFTETRLEHFLSQKCNGYIPVLMDLFTSSVL